MLLFPVAGRSKLPEFVGDGLTAPGFFKGESEFLNGSPVLWFPIDSFELKCLLISVDPDDMTFGLAFGWALLFGAPALLIIAVDGFFGFLRGDPWVLARITLSLVENSLMEVCDREPLLALSAGFKGKVNLDGSVLTLVLFVEETIFLALVKGFLGCDELELPGKRAETSFPD